MVQRASSEAPSISGGQRESRMGLGIGYTAYQSGYNKLFTQVSVPKMFDRLYLISDHLIYYLAY